MANKLVEIIPANAASHGDREAYRFTWRKEGEWQSTTWSELNIQVNIAGKALQQLGLIEKDTIAICSPNTPQIFITELGAFQNRIACIPLYSSSSQKQFDYITDNGGASVIFVGDSHQYPLAYNYWKKNPDRVKTIVVFKNDGLELRADDTVSIFWDDFVRLGMNAPEECVKEVNRRMEAGLPDDIATLIYTSGTTGEPKGVALTHRNYDAAIREHLEFLTMLNDSDVSMSFLPMSHIFEKAWCFFCLTKRIPIAVNYDPRIIQTTIHDIHPNLMCCVPRFWEKVYAAVKDKIESMSALQRMLVRRALNVGRRRNLEYKRVGKKAPALLEKEYQFWNRKVFQKLKDAIGIPNPNMFPTAGAPLSDRIVEFMRSVGIDIVIGYGLSETTATVSVYPEVGYEIGTIGKPLPNVKVRIDDNGEILVKGETVTPGYYNNPKANEEAFTEDGYFRTGDAGYFTPDGAIVLTERLKDLFKTSNGKYIAPQMLESRMAENRFIDQAAVIGDQRKFVTALIVADRAQLTRWAEENGVRSGDYERLVKDPKTIAFMMDQINTIQEGIAEYEKIKRITILSSPFSVETGELTNTLKVKRPVVARNYASQIEAMYVGTER